MNNYNSKDNKSPETKKCIFSFSLVQLVLLIGWRRMDELIMSYIIMLRQHSP